MAEYKFIGTEALLRLDNATVQLRRIGQSVNLTDEQYDAIKARVPLVSADAFKGIGLSDDQVLRFGDSAVQDRAPQEFHDKLAVARMNALGIKPEEVTNA